MTMQHKGRLCGLALLAALLAGTSSAHAITTHIYGSVDRIMGPPNTISGYEQYDRHSAGAQSNGIVYTQPGGGDNPLRFSANVYTEAGAGGVHVNTSMITNRANPISDSDTGFINFWASGQASVTFSDFVITGPGTAPITTRFSVRLDGLQEVGASQYGNSSVGGAAAAASVSVNLAVNGFSAGEAYNERQVAGGSAPTSLGYGGLENFGGDTVLQSEEFTVTPNEKFSVTLRLGATSISSLRDDASGLINAKSDFSNTLTFVNDRPIFLLPAGYTVHSESAGITDNHLAGAPPVVPEPTSLIMLALAAPLALGRFRRLA